MSPVPSPRPEAKAWLCGLALGTAAAAALAMALAAPPADREGFLEVAPAAAQAAGMGPGPQAHAAARAPGGITEEAARVAQAAEGLAEGEAARRLAQFFGATIQQVADLRDQKLSFTDVAAALAVAQVSRKPVNTVVALWANERLGWNDVAARLGAPRRRVVRELRRAREWLDASPAR